MSGSSAVPGHPVAVNSPTNVAPSTAPTVTLTVTSVADGRTIVTSDGKQVRLSGLTDPAPCWATVATGFLRNAVQGKTVWVSVEAEGTPRVARVQLTDTTDVSVLTISKGFGRVASYAAGRAELTKAETTAKQTAVGLWGDPCRGSDTTPKPTTSSPPPTSEPNDPGEPSTPAKPGEVYYKTCADARRAGAAPLFKGQPGYREGLDRHHTGVACWF
ncbi:calcium-binding protein [Solihabitans fulvus]|uniref:Calcium-binding protein n=2 Tax=Solihabitans fulvus TaxID=1892852 RepID=A0A5B2XF59_9PSEU|nr:calcium-binding protein [Solihabitans fulvus]